MIRSIAPLWLWGITASLLLFITVGSSIGYTIWYVQQIEHVQCDSLNDILANGHILNSQFRHAIEEWAVSYRCPQASQFSK
jgi:hypothetical protein